MTNALANLRRNLPSSALFSFSLLAVGLFFVSALSKKAEKIQIENLT